MKLVAANALAYLGYIVLARPCAKLALEARYLTLRPDKLYACRHSESHLTKLGGTPAAYTRVKQ